MNIQEMLSKMNAQMLSQGLKEISKNLSPQQLKQAEAAIKATNLSGSLKSNDPNALLAELQQNPELLVKLSRDPALMKNLQNIVKTK